MRMTSFLLIAIGVIFIVVAVNNNLSYVFKEITSIGKTTSSGQSQPPGNSLAPNCIDPATGRYVPCIDKNSLNGIQQNMVNL